MNTNATQLSFGEDGETKEVSLLPVDKEVVDAPKGKSIKSKVNEETKVIEEQEEPSAELYIVFRNISGFSLGSRYPSNKFSNTKELVEAGYLIKSDKITDYEKLDLELRKNKGA